MVFSKHYTLVLLGCLVAPAAAKAKAEAPAKSPIGQHLELTSSLKPRLALRKRVRVPERVADFITGVLVGADVGLDGSTSFEASVRDKYIDGKISLRTNVCTDGGAPERTLEWTKAFILPGLLDSATRLTLRSTLDLRTGAPSGEVKLGLRRRQPSRGLRLVQRLAVPLEGTPFEGRCFVDVGATVTLPDDLHLGTEEGAGPKQLLDSAQFGVDADTLILHLEL